MWITTKSQMDNKEKNSKVTHRKNKVILSLFLEFFLFFLKVDNSFTP